MATRFLSLRSVKDQTSLSRSTVYRLQALGTFPASVPLGGRVAWVADEVEAWCLDRVAARRGAPVA